MTSPRRRSGRRAPNISTLCAQHPVTHGTGVYLAGSPERLLPSDGLRSSGIGPLSSLWDPHLSARFLGSASLFLSATASQQTRLPRALLPLHTPGHRPFPAASPTLAASHSAPPSLVLLLSPGSPANSEARLLLLLSMWSSHGFLVIFCFVVLVAGVFSHPFPWNWHGFATTDPTLPF